MRKFKEFVRNNIKFFVGIIFGILLSIGTSFAATIIYDSDQVRYDNTTSGMASTDVQGALDELYARRPQGDAIDDQVLSGYTFSNATASGIAGTMQNLSGSTQYQHTSSNTTKTLLADASYYTTLYNNSTSSDVGKYISFRWNKQDLPDGSKLGNGYITTNTLFTRPASDFGNASANQVLSGTTFTSSNGLKISGTMPNRGSAQWSTGVGSGGSGSDAYISLQKIPAGYYPEDSSSSWAPEIRIKQSTVASKIGLTAAKIVKGNTILGISGTANPSASRVRLWSGSTTGNVSVSLSGYTWVYVVTTGGNLLLQVNGAAGYTGYIGTSPDGMWGTWGGARGYKATTSGITATTNTYGATENKGASWISIKEVWGIKNLS